MSIDDARRELLFCDSYSRLPTLLDLWPSLDERQAATLLGEVWQVCDNVGMYLDDVLEVLPSWLSAVPEMMTRHERAALAALPARVTVYRGADRGVNERGLSWSLNRDVAAAFPRLMRYRAKQPVLVTGIVRRRDIIALKLGRREREVIAWEVRVRATDPILTE